MSVIPTDLPVYLQEGNEENYNEEFNQTLRGWFSSNGFFLPALTSVQVTALMALTPAPQQLQWINSTTNKLQFIDTTGTVQTVTSV